MTPSARMRLLLGVLALAFVAPAHAAALTIPADGVTMEILDGNGRANQAGAHPERLMIGFTFDESGGPENPRYIFFDLPAGLLGDLGSIPACRSEVFAEVETEQVACPIESQVGRMLRPNGAVPFVHSIEAGADQAALMGTVDPRIAIPASFRPDDQGLRLELQDLGHLPESLSGSKIELWGIPADRQEGTAIPRRPFLTLPTRCDGPPLSVRVSVQTWEHPGEWKSGTGSTGLPLSGCEQISFDPSAGLTLTSHIPDSPTGAGFDLASRQNLDPDGRASSTIREVEMALPQGMAISAPGAAGLSACTDAQLAPGAQADPSCPEASKVGTVAIETPQAAKPLRGAVYLGSERPGDRFRLFIVASGSGSRMKVIGSLRPDPLSDRLRVKLPDLPQIALAKMTLGFDGGPGALLATPLACGPATAIATFTPYSGTGPVSRSPSASIECSGGGFNPGFDAGTLDTKAGAATAFTATLTRRDGEQLPERLAIAFPQGLSTSLRSIALCGDAQASARSCPPTSRVGSALADLGPGQDSARLKGDVYFTAAYKGAPFGLLIVFDAKLGPYDLGKLAIRASVDVDPQTGQVEVRTDPLPTEADGIPIRLRTLGLEIDRPGFLHNPTSCAPAAVGAEVRSTQGARARPSAPFRAQGCIALPFAPKFALALSNRSQLHRSGRPGLAIAGRVPPGDANLANATVGLPALLRLDSSRLEAICSRADAQRGRCPKGAKVGTATARTPMLAEALAGTVYAVQPKGDGTPDIWTMLEGSGLKIVLRSETELAHGRLTTKLTDLPDFTLRSFVLRFDGGRDGVIKLRRDPCAKRLLAPIVAEGQNKALRRFGARVAVRGCGRG